MARHKEAETYIETGRSQEREPSGSNKVSEQGRTYIDTIALQERHETLHSVPTQPEIDVAATWKSGKAAIEQLSEGLKDNAEEKKKFSESIEGFGRYIREYYSLGGNAQIARATLREILPAEAEDIEYLYKRDGERLVQVVEKLATTKTETDRILVKYIMDMTTEDAEKKDDLNKGLHEALEDSLGWNVNKVDDMIQTVEQLLGTIQNPFDTFATKFINTRDDTDVGSRVAEVETLERTAKDKSDECFDNLIEAIAPFLPEPTDNYLEHETKVDITGENHADWQILVEAAIIDPDSNFFIMRPEGTVENTGLKRIFHGEGSKPEFDRYYRDEKVEVDEDGVRKVKTVHVARMVTWAEVYRSDSYDDKHKIKAGESTFMRNAYEKVKIPIESVRLNSLPKCLDELEDLDAAMLVNIRGVNYYVVPRRDADGNLTRGEALPVDVYNQWKIMVVETKSEFNNVGFKDADVIDRQMRTLADSFEPTSGTWLESRIAQNYIESSLNSFEAHLSEDDEEKEAKKRRLAGAREALQRLCDFDIGGRELEYKQLAIQRIIDRHRQAGEVVGPGLPGWETLLKTELQQEALMVAAEYAYRNFAIKDLAEEVQRRTHELKLLPHDENVADADRQKTLTEKQAELERLLLNIDYEMEMRTVALSLVGKEFNGNIVDSYAEALEIVRSSYKSLMQESGAEQVNHDLRDECEKLEGLSESLASEVQQGIEQHLMEIVSLSQEVQEYLARRRNGDDLEENSREKLVLAYNNLLNSIQELDLVSSRYVVGSVMELIAKGLQEDNNLEDAESLERELSYQGNNVKYTLSVYDQAQSFKERFDNEVKNLASIDNLIKKVQGDAAETPELSNLHELWQAVHMDRNLSKEELSRVAAKQIELLVKERVANTEAFYNDINPLVNPPSNENIWWGMSETEAAAVKDTTINKRENLIRYLNSRYQLVSNETRETINELV
jgi:hypothetical protein